MRLGLNIDSETRVQIYNARGRVVADSKDNTRKVIRGGSWKDVAYFLQVSTRDFEYQDSARSYIGFRTVQDYMGEEDSTQ